MRYLGSDLVRRENDTFVFEEIKIPAARKAGNGFGVLLLCEAPTQVDHDLKPIIARILRRKGINVPLERVFGWFISAEELERIRMQLDTSDHLTSQTFYGGRGWDGVRPFPHYYLQKVPAEPQAPPKRKVELLHEVLE